MSETTDAQIEEAHRIATWLRMRADAEMARFQAAEPSDDRVLKAMVLGQATALRDAAEAIESGWHYADLRAGWQARRLTRRQQKMTKEAGA